MQPQAELTAALEDYLETIYQLVVEHKVARVRDICKARHVKAGSVTPAMKRLAELGLIVYNVRDSIDLTPEGERLARRVFARHNMLTRFFGELLQIDGEKAEADACAMEHHLSDEGMDRLTRLFEFIQQCGSGQGNFMERFRQCARIHDRGEACTAPGCAHREAQAMEGMHKHRHDGPGRRLCDLHAGESGVIAQVVAQGAARQRLLDMGMLPSVAVTMEGTGPRGDTMLLHVQGYPLSIPREEACNVALVE